MYWSILLNIILVILVNILLAQAIHRNEEIDKLMETNELLKYEIEQLKKHKKKIDHV